MPHFPRRSRILSLVAGLISSAWADYYIDDTNTTLTYSSGPKAAWAPYAVGATTLELLLPNGTYQVIDAFVCYNHTYRYAACFDTDDCLLTIPFTGSGITVYVYQAGPVGINASITVDGSHAKTNVLNAPPAPAYQIANVSMFDVQQLPSGSHTLSLLINNLFGSYTGMMFDYAFVNESLVANTQTTTTSAAIATGSTDMPAGGTSPQMSITRADNINTGAIVGGVFGAIALIVAGILGFLLMRRRRRRHGPEMINLHSDSASPPITPRAGYDALSSNTPGTYDPYAGYNPPSNNTMGDDLTSSRSPELSSITPLVPNRFGAAEVRRMPSSLSNGQQDIPLLTPFTATPGSNTSSGVDSKSRLMLSNDTTDVATEPRPPETGHSPSAPRQDASPLLTDEQADFINSLHQNNVPAAAIARVVERMLADRHAGIREWERETRLARSNSMTTAPPSYDLVAERGY